MSVSEGRHASISKNVLTTQFLPLQHRSESERRSVRVLCLFRSLDQLIFNLIQKCDAKRPCTTCTVAKTAAECVYDDQKIPYPTSFDSYDADDYSEGQPELGNTELVELSVPDGCTSQDILAHYRSSGTIDIIPREQRVKSMDKISRISISPSFLHTSIPPGLRLNLSFLGEENLQVRTSETDATDTDMKSCVF